MKLSHVKHILFPTDLSEDSLVALQWAVELTSWHKAVLHIIHVVPASPLYQPEDFGITDATTEWEEAMNKLLNNNVPEVLTNEGRLKSAVLTNYSVADEIIQYSEQHQIDLLIIGTHGRSSFPNPTLLGGTAGKIIRKSNIPVLTWRLTGQHKKWSQPAHILAPVDFSDQSSESLRIAKEWVDHYDASLSVLFVAEERIVPIFNDTLTPGVFVMKLDDDQVDRARRALDKLFKKVNGAGASASFHVKQGHPAHEILEFTNEQEVDLIIMSAHGHRGTTLFTLGSTTDRVVRKAPCAVLIHRSEMLLAEED